MQPRGRLRELALKLSQLGWLLSRFRASCQRGAADPRPLEWTGKRAGASAGAFCKPFRAHHKVVGRLPRPKERRRRHWEETVGSENLAASPAHDPCHLSQPEESFSFRTCVLPPPSLPRSLKAAALGSRTPRAPRVSVGNLLLRHERRRGLQAAAVAQPNRLPTAPQAGGWGGGAERWPVRLRAHAFRCGAGLARGPAQAWRLRAPYLPTSSAWRRRCVRRGLPRVLRAGAAHWSLVLEAAAAAAAAAPAAPPPPPVVAVPRARAPAPAPLSATPRAPFSPSAAGNMRLRSRRPASE